MLSTTLQSSQSQSVYTEIANRPNTVSLAAWIQHYQAEAIDLRYFFHSGWSS